MAFSQGSRIISGIFPIRSAQPRFYLSSFISASATMQGRNAWTIQAGFLLNRHCSGCVNNEVKEKSASPAQQLSKGVLGLQMCMSAGLRVHVQLETLQLSQRSSGASGPGHQLCPAVPPSSPSRSADFAVITHTDTHRVCSCPLSWQQPHTGTGLWLCQCPPRSFS